MTDSFLGSYVILVAHLSKRRHCPKIGRVKIGLVRLHVVDGGDQCRVPDDEAARAVPHNGSWINERNVPRR